MLPALLSESVNFASTVYTFTNAQNATPFQKMTLIKSGNRVKTSLANGDEFVKTAFTFSSPNISPTTSLVLYRTLNHPVYVSI
jgi:uncharacterized membrane protein YjfL (UPF0719 family)